MGTPSIDTTSHDAVITTDNTPTEIAVIVPDTGWYGQVSAVVHAYSTADKSVCASFVVRGVAERVSAVPAVHLTGMHDFDSTAALAGITAELVTGSHEGANYVLLKATGHETIELEWHVRTTTMFEAA